MVTYTNKYWRESLQLESAELVKRIYSQIHGRDLNTTRARQIVASYQQGKEYYRNAAQSDVSVKPLLLFYGVSSLSRCLTLLLRQQGGEETLSQSHGLSCTGWRNILTTDVSASLPQLGKLQVQSCAGAFIDLLTATENRTYLHVRSGAPDWSVGFDMPGFPITVNFGDVLKRIPDLRQQYSLWTQQSPHVISVNDMTSAEERFEIKFREQDNLSDIISYAEGHYTLSDEPNNIKKLTIPHANLPLFVNSYVEKAFGAIPNLYIASPFPQGDYIAQIPHTFILAYYLGMLSRYFPSHWMALYRGSKGDEAWPLVQASMHYIESAFPQLLTEFIAEHSKQEPNN